MSKDLRQICSHLAASMKGIALCALYALTAIAATLVLANVVNVAARADDYPSRPVQLIIPFAAGGPTDIVGRIMAAKMSELLGQQLVVENRSGAGGNIGAEAVAKASPDGYTILMATVSTNAINPGLYTHMPYDAIRDFAPLGRIGVTPTLLLVNPSIPASDVKSLIALIKANPGKYNYGSSGVGSILHLCGEEFKALAGDLEITHVPYKGSAPMDTDLLGGQIAMAFDATPTAMPLAKSGKLRALGAGMAKRLPAMPDLPTLQEQGLHSHQRSTRRSRRVLGPGKSGHRSDARQYARDHGRIRQGGTRKMGTDHQSVGRTG
jgi:tripartite-type tricarboxylate transporter receptor subunit TctC